MIPDCRIRRRKLHLSSLSPLASFLLVPQYSHYPHLFSLLVWIGCTAGDIAHLAAFHPEPFHEGLDLGRTTFNASLLLDSLLSLSCCARGMLLKIGFQSGSVFVQFAGWARITELF